MQFRNELQPVTVVHAVRVNIRMGEDIPVQTEGKAEFNQNPLEQLVQFESLAFVHLTSESHPETSKQDLQTDA